MTTWGLFLFLAFFALQIFLPLRRFVSILLFRKGRGDLLANNYDHFSWTAHMRLGAGYVDFTVFDRQTGDKIVVICPNQILIKEQYTSLSVTPSLQIQYAHFLKASMSLDKFNYGVRGYCEINTNDRGWKKMVNPFTDLAREPIKAFGLYYWHE